MKKNIIIAAKAFVLNALDNELSVESLSEYIKDTLDCELIFYDVKENAEEFKRIRLFNLAKRRDAFVYIDEHAAKLKMYVKKNNSRYDMVLLMLHEIGHIVLQHLPTATKENTRKQDIEADAFTYFVITALGKIAA